MQYNDTNTVLAEGLCCDNKCTFTNSQKTINSPFSLNACEKFYKHYKVLITDKQNKKVSKQ